LTYEGTLHQRRQPHDPSRPARHSVCEPARGTHYSTILARNRDF
jgi:hypothetical protein